MLMRLVQLHSQAGGNWLAIDYTDFGPPFRRIPHACANTAEGSRR